MQAMDLMEQLYLLEIFVDKVTVFGEEDDTSILDKRFIIKINYGPIEFFIKEQQLAENPDPNDVEDVDEDDNKRFTREMRVGKSLLFPSYPDMMILDFGRCNLHITVWTSVKNEDPIFLGVTTSLWEPAFYEMIRETAKPCAKIEPVTMKRVEPLWAECCCKKCGEISLIVRFSPLGDCITTQFQQSLQNPDSFVYLNDKTPNKFECKRVDGNENVCNGGYLYSMTLKDEVDPDCLYKITRKINVCTQLKSCGLKGANGEDRRCEYAETIEPRNKPLPIDKVRLGNIRGPCGNTNCTLAHKVKNYIRNLDTYKSVGEARLGVPKSNVETTKNACGKCICREDRWHAGFCEPKKEKKPKDSVCNDCGGLTAGDDTCQDRVKKHFDTGATPPDGRSFKSMTANVLYKSMYDAFPSRNDAGKIIYKVDNILLDNDWPSRRGRDKSETPGRSCASSCIQLSSHKSSIRMNK